jgi:hypothetical protein
MDWIVEHWKDILAIIGAVVSLATLITAITPSQRDNEILEKIIKILSALGLLNPDKSFIGKKEEDK